MNRLAAAGSASSLCQQFIVHSPQVDSFAQLLVSEREDLRVRKRVGDNVRESDRTIAMPRRLGISERNT